MVEITWRSATEADAASIAAIHVASWRDAYSSILDPDFLAGPVEADRLSLWSMRLRTAAPAQLVHVAEDLSHTQVGFICAYRDADPRWGSLVDNLHVIPQMRRRSIGERLLRSAVEGLRDRGSQMGLHLWVFEANKSALRFYMGLGAKIVEHDVSRIPAANRKTVLRVHWAALDELVSPQGADPQALCLQPAHSQLFMRRGREQMAENEGPVTEPTVERPPRNGPL